MQPFILTLPEYDHQPIFSRADYVVFNIGIDRDCDYASWLCPVGKLAILVVCDWSYGLGWRDGLWVLGLIFLQGEWLPQKECILIRAIIGLFLSYLIFIFFLNYSSLLRLNFLLSSFLIGYFRRWFHIIFVNFFNQLLFRFGLDLLHKFSINSRLRYFEHFVLPGLVLDDGRLLILLFHFFGLFGQTLYIDWNGDPEDFLFLVELRLGLCSSERVLCRSHILK